MQIDEKLLQRIESLAGIRVEAPEERKRLLQDLNQILSLIRRLEELNVEDVEPLLSVHDQVQILRGSEEQEPPLPREEILNRAPDTWGPYIRVPRFVFREQNDAPQSSET